MKYNVKQVWSFPLINFGWYSIHLDIVQQEHEGVVICQGSYCTFDKKSFIYMEIVTLKKATLNFWNVEGLDVLFTTFEIIQIWKWKQNVQQKTCT